jgi:phosphate transport system protein
VRATRDRFIGGVRQLEIATVVAMELAADSLESVTEAVRTHDLELARTVIANDQRIDSVHARVNETGVNMLATQAAVAGDLRTVAGLFGAIRCIERIGDQCVNIATLLPLSGPAPPRDEELLQRVDEIGRLARQRASAAHEALKTESVEAADRAGWDRRAAERLTREILRRAVEVGDTHDRREWAMHMVLAGLALERIGRNAQSVAAQVPFVISGTWQQRVAIEPTAAALAQEEW